MGGRALLVMLVGIFAISATIFESITTSSNNISANAGAYEQRITAKNLAQSGANIALRQLAVNASWRTGFPLMGVMGGKILVQVADVTFTGKPVVRITSTGIASYGTSMETRDTTIVYVAKGSVPGSVKGAITANDAVTTLGNLVLDGRDHTSAGVLIAGQGIFGLWTTGTLSQSGSSTIGGTLNKTDYTPSKPANANSVACGQSSPGGYPGTPDSVMGGAPNGYAEGTLKSMAQAGTNGSQYVTDPSRLKSPLQGVTYVELPSSGSWTSANIAGSGILVVHNAAKNSLFTNLNSGTFTGLVIADDVVHIHAQIIGALVVLTHNPSQGNSIGNGNGSVLFSSQAVINATGGGTQASGQGSASKVIAWWD